MVTGLGVAHSLLLKATDLRDDADHIHVVSICLFVFLLCACIVLGHLLEENRWMNESITALLLGLCTGAVVLVSSKGQSSHVLKFDEELFFIYLLPPIIFNAGFQVKKKEFFRNFIAIMLFGVIGVFISFAIISTGTWYLFPKLGVPNLPIRDILAIGVIFSATDSVCTLQVLNQDDTPLLYSLVFGEGVVNDATSVVLFRAVQTYNFDNFTPLEGFQIAGSFLYLFSSSCILGIASGLISAYIIKTMYFGRHSTDREIAIMILMAYLSYILAELFYLSGILSVFFCGIVMSHYTWHNVTESSRTTTKHSFATMSFIAETFIFLYVGMDALDLDKWKQSQSSFKESAGLFGSLMGLILLGRAAFVFPLSAVSNYFTKSPAPKINIRQMAIIWWAGLMRGAVSIALAFNQFTQSGDAKSSSQATLMVTTIIVVLFSTIVFGTATKPLIIWLLPPKFSCVMELDLQTSEQFLAKLRLKRNNDASPIRSGPAEKACSADDTGARSTDYPVWRRISMVTQRSQPNGKNTHKTRQIEWVIHLQKVAHGLMTKLHKLHQILEPSEPGSMHYRDSFWKTGICPDMPKLCLHVARKFPEHPAKMQLDKVDKAGVDLLHEHAGGYVATLEPWIMVLEDLMTFREQSLRVILDLSSTVVTLQPNQNPLLLRVFMDIFCSFVRVNLLADKEPAKPDAQVHQLQ